MIKNSFSNPCVLCGKQRIVTKIKKERINGSLVITTLTSCPDPECQKKLLNKLEKEKEERANYVSSVYPPRRGRFPRA